MKKILSHWFSKRLAAFFVLILFSHVKLFATPADAVLAARTKMIQFAADHFLQAMNAYFWSLTIDREAGKAVDSYEYALARRYFDNNSTHLYRSYALTQRFKFIQDNEFKVVNVEPDRIAILTSDGTILWNAEKLSTVAEFSIFDAMKILAHELNHSITELNLQVDDGLVDIQLLPLNQKPTMESKIAKILNKQKMLRSNSATVAVDLSTKDKFDANFVAFLQDHTLESKDATGLRQFSILNLILSTDPNEQTEVFKQRKAFHIHKEGLLGWSSVGSTQFSDETERLEILYGTEGHTKLASKGVYEEVDGYTVKISRYSADIQPEIQIQSITVQTSGQIRINFALIQRPFFFNDSRLRAFEHLDRKPLPQLDSTVQNAKAIFEMQQSHVKSDKEPIDGSSLELSYRSNLIASNIKLVNIDDQHSERAFTFDVTGLNVDATALKMPILVCVDKSNQRYTFTADQIVQNGQDLKAIFKSKYGGALSPVEIVWPGYQSSLRVNYVEYVVRAQGKIEIPAHAQFTNQQIALSENLKIEDIRFDFDGQLVLKINGDPNDLSKIDSLLVELNHFREYKLNSMNVDGRNPYWTQLIGEKISIPSNKLKKYLKSNQLGVLEFLIPINQLSELVNNIEVSEGLQATDTTGRRISGVSLVTVDGALIKLDLEKQPLFDAERAEYLKKLKKYNLNNSSTNNKIRDIFSELRLGDILEKWGFESQCAGLFK